MRIFILAGEPSGDRLAADLVARLRGRDPDLEIAGVGGDELIAQGLNSLFPMRELSVMGWSDIIPRLPWLYNRAFQVARTIVRLKPDVVVFVDAQIFSAVVARRVRKAGYTAPILLYVAPSVWAWAPERAAKLKPVFDEILGVLPFEPRVMRELGGPPTQYVGHPAVANFAMRRAQPESGPLMLMPGSREGELRRHLPMFRATAERLANHPRVTGFVLPTLPFLAARLKTEVNRWDVPVTVVTSAEDREEAFAASVAALTSMGTSTLELALAGVPMVGTYVADSAQVGRFFKYGARYTCLPNIVLNRLLVPEVLFDVPDADELGTTVARTLQPARIERQLAGFREMREVMERGAPGDGLADAVDRVQDFGRLAIGT